MIQKCPETCPLIDRPEVSFYLKRCRAQESLIIERGNLNRIIFFLYGDAVINSEDCQDFKVEEKHFVFCYKEHNYNITPTSDIDVIIAEFVNPGSMCDLGALFKIFKSHKLQYEYEALPFTEPLRDWMVPTMRLLHDGIQCSKMHESVLETLFGFFRFYYTPEELSNFFFHLLSHGQSFKQLVENERPKAKNLNHLAELCGYDINSFNTMFRRYYDGAVPYRWMQEQKSKDVYKALCETDLPINVISDNFGFSGTGQFSKFCKRFLGETPLHIRRLHYAQLRDINVESD